MSRDCQADLAPLTEEKKFREEPMSTVIKGVLQYSVSV